MYSLLEHRTTGFCIHGAVGDWGFCWVVSVCAPSARRAALRPSPCTSDFLSLTCCIVSFRVMLGSSGGRERLRLAFSGKASNFSSLVGFLNPVLGFNSPELAPDSSFLQCRRWEAAGDSTDQQAPATHLGNQDWLPGSQLRLQLWPGPALALPWLFCVFMKLLSGWELSACHSNGQTVVEFSSELFGFWVFFHWKESLYSTVLVWILIVCAYERTSPFKLSNSWA